MNTQILLFALNASFSHMALGVLTLAEYINSHENAEICSVLECNINERDDEILYKLYENAKGKKIVGFSCYIWNIEKMLKFGRNLKKLLPDIFIIFGGPEVSYYDKDEFYSLYPFVDLLIQGEGEEELLAVWERFKPPRQPARRLTGWSDLYQHAENYHTIYYESSRGCPYNCAYCISGIENTKVRAKDVELVLKELEAIENQYYNNENSKINIIKFCDRTFNFNVNRANEIYKNLIERAKKRTKKLLPYQFEIYPSLFNEESFGILATAPVGLFQMEIGIQSLNPETLEAIGRKNFDITQALENIAKIKSFGNIHIHVDLIAGLPYEDLAGFINGFNRLFEKTNPDFIQIGFLKLLRGTKIREEAEVHGYIHEENPPYTVLCNNYMSFEDITFLRDIEKIYRRYRSKAYEKTFRYIYGNYFTGNVFGIFELLAKFWRTNNLFAQPRTQKDAFEAFFNAFEESGILGNSQLCELIELLESDFYTYEKKKLRISRGGVFRE